MKKFFLAFVLLSKRQLKNVFFAILLVMIPMITYVCGLIPELSESPTNLVAYYVEDEGERAERIVRELENGEANYQFVAYDSLSAMKTAVIKDQAIAGYYFAEDFSKKLEQGKSNKIITVYSKENNLLADSVNEIVFSRFYKEYCEIVALEYTASNATLRDFGETAQVEVAKQYQKYANGSEIFTVVFEELQDGTSLEESTVVEQENITFPLRGILSIVLLLSMFLGMIQYNMDANKGMFKTLRGGYVYVGRILYILVPVLYSGLMSLVCISFTREHKSFLVEVGAMICYLCILVLVGACAGLVIKNNEFLLGIIPVLLIVTLLICPVFVDLKDYFPSTQWVRIFLLPHYYLKFFA